MLSAHLIVNSIQGTQPAADDLSMPLYWVYVANGQLLAVVCVMTPVQLLSMGDRHARRQ